MTQTAGATCPTCAATLPAAGAPCPRCATPPPGPRFPQQHPSGPFPAGAQQPMTPYPPYRQYPVAPYPQPYPPQPFPQPYAAHPVRAVRSPGVAVLLTFLWIGAGHLYLDRIGTGLVLMGAHFVVGFFLFFLFFPLGFVAWLAAVITCSVICSNLAHQINAGTAPPRSSW